MSVVRYQHSLFVFRFLNSPAWIYLLVQGVSWPFLALFSVFLYFLFLRLIYLGLWCMRFWLSHLSLVSMLRTLFLLQGHVGASVMLLGFLLLLVSRLPNIWLARFRRSGFWRILKYYGS